MLHLALRHVSGSASAKPMGGRGLATSESKGAQPTLPASRAAGGILVVHQRDAAPSDALRHSHDSMALPKQTLDSESEISYPVSRFGRLLSMRVLALLFAIAGVGLAQNPSASVVGRITDPTGAVIPGVTIKITSIDTNLSQQARSNESGDYTVPFLNPGRYSLEATA